MIACGQSRLKGLQFRALGFGAQGSWCRLMSEVGSAYVLVVWD